MALQLRCPNCSTPVPADHINITSLIGKCSKCNSVFEFKEELKKQEIKVRPHIELPKGFDVQKGVSDLRITISWRKTKMVWFFVLFSAFWNGIVFIFVAIAIATNNWMMALMISIHFIIGVSFLLYTISLFVNASVLHANTHALRVTHGPLPVPFHPKRHIPATDLDQLYVEEYVASRTNGRPNIAFRLKAALKNQNKHIRLMNGLKHPEQALYLEHEIEKFMGIENREIGLAGS